MKTSKKLLSLFLAAVMAVTSCSIGFTAFAQENNKSIWSTDADAESAYAALNQLVDELVPVLLENNSIKSLLEDSLGMTVTDETSIKDVLYAVQPVLLELFGSKQTEFVDTYYTGTDYEKFNYLNTDNLCTECGKYWSDDQLLEKNGDSFCPDGCANYASSISDNYCSVCDTEWTDDQLKVVDGVSYCPNGCLAESSTVKTATMSYYTLVNLCATFKEDKVKLSDGSRITNPLSSEQKQTLSDWYDKLMPLSQLATATEDKILEYAKVFYDDDLEVSYLNAPLCSLEAYDFEITDEDNAIFEGIYPRFNQKLADEYYVPEGDITIDSLAKLIYYFYGRGISLLKAYQAYHLITMATDEVSYQSNDVLMVDFTGAVEEWDWNLQNITPANCAELIQNGLEENMADLLTEMNMTFDDAVTLVMGCNNLEKAYGKLYNEEIDCFLDVILFDEYYPQLLAGIALNEGAIDNADEYFAAVKASLPTGDFGSQVSILNDFELKNLKIAAHSAMSTNYGTDYVDGFFTNDTYTVKIGTTPVTLTLPQILKGTSTADYLRLVLGHLNIKDSKYENYKKALVTALFPNFSSASKSYEMIDSNTMKFGDDGLPIILDGNDPDFDTINTYFAAADEYAYSKVFTDLTGMDGSVKDSATGLTFIIDVEGYLDSQITDSTVAVLSDEQIAVLNDSYDLANEMGALILNTKLNDKILSIVQLEVMGNTVEDLLNMLIETNCDLVTALDDLWLRLVDNLVNTVFELLPVLLVLVDELIEPLLLNAKGDFWNKLLEQVRSTSTIFGDMTVEAGSYIGIAQLAWDLNELLPALMHWLLEDEDYSYTYYTNGTVPVYENVSSENLDLQLKQTAAADVDTADVKHYTVVDQDGNELTRDDSGKKKAIFTYMGESSKDLSALMAKYPDAVFSYSMTYESDVPYITGIYIADLALRDAKISDLEGIFTKLFSDSDNPETIGAILAEVVTELAVFFTDAVDTFVADPTYRDEKKYDADGNVVGSGLNNLFVAVPQLFDIMENQAAEKYSIDENNWTYCYEGKLFYDSNNHIKNSSLEAFKQYASSDESDRSIAVFDVFAEVFIEDWFNAIISLLNNVISTDNAISNEVPVIAGLLNALGGFGEQSIITDVLNSVFQITRDNKYSFTFDNENINENNSFTGLSKDNAYFLIANIPRLIEVIKNLINHFDSDAADSSGSTTTTAVTKPKVYAPGKATTPKADSSTYTNQDLSNATDLINNLDKLLSSLLSDSTFNDFSLDKTDNILASLVTFLSNYLGNDFAESADEIVRLINSYTYYITGSETHKADKNNNVDEKKVYTNDSLTGLVVETYTLVEKLAAKLLEDFDDTYALDDSAKAQYNLLVEAIDGIISPDATAIRLADDYDDAAKTIVKYNSWQNMAKTTSRGDYSVSIDWGIKAGDKDAFYDALSASLRTLTSVIGVLLIDTGWYNTVITPVLSALCTPNGITLTSYNTLVADKEATGYYDETLIAILTPVSSWINTLLDKPVTTLIKSIQGIAGILDDKNGATLASIIKGVLEPLADEVNGLANILDAYAENDADTDTDNDTDTGNDTDTDNNTGISNLTPTGAATVRKLADNLISKTETNSSNALVNLKVGKTYKDSAGNLIADYSLPLSGANLIPIINTYLASSDITLMQINWNKLSKAKTPAAALVYILEYVIETVLNLPALQSLLETASDLIGLDLSALSDISPRDLLAVINRILEASDSPTMAYWTFAQYLQELSTGFKYPAGITAAMANEGVDSLETLVANIFPLLSSFGLDVGDDLGGVLDKYLYTNSLLTTIATALYGALDGLDPTIKSVINGLGIATSTKDVAKLLTDKSYGSTYTSAAKTIKAQSSWSKVKNINWGFKDGSSAAQQGFINALAAILRPVNSLLAVFLNEGELHIDDALYEIICSLEVKRTTTNLEFDIGDQHFNARIAYAMKNGVFAVSIREDPSTSSRSRSSTLKLDLKSLKDLDDLKLVGTNGYNSAIIPLLEALQCSGISTYAQYQKDVAKAKDNLIIDILNPILGTASTSLISKLCAKPVATIINLLPNVAMYLDADGLIQLVTNLLAPISYTLSDGKNPSASVAAIIENLLGAPIQDMIIPLVNKLLKNTGITLPDIDWAFLASLGTPTTYTSKATGLNGRYITGKMVKNIDGGKVLITVLRYVADVLIDNASTIKNLICSIDAIKKNDTLKSIIASVFNTIGTASTDQLVAAVFYLLSSDPSNAFWDYTSYKTGSYSFSYPGTVDVDFLKSLSPMLDGLIGGLVDLNGLVTENLFTDSIVSKLATGLYGAVEGVNISDSLNLAELLAQTDIDFTTSNVASLLVNEKYGQTYESAAAVISAAGSWKNVDADSLKWGVTDRDSFFHALVAVLRPIYGVLDVLLNDAYLGLFDLVKLPGSNGYTSSIVPLMEAFSMYNIKTQYQYRQDMNEEYDAILLDIINPIWDKVEDILNAPIQTIAAVIPNLALFIGNDGLCQIIDNLLTPISALADAIRPVIDLNDLLNTVFDSLDFDLGSTLAKIGVSNFTLDVYNLDKTLSPLLSGDSIISLVNGILGIIEIKDTKLGIKLNDVDWLKLASHGTTIVGASQAATYGARIYVEGDSSETLIAVLRYLIDTVNAGDNFQNISSLIVGLLGDSVSDSISDVINQVLGMLQGDTDEVISSLVELLQTFA